MTACATDDTHNTMTGDTYKYIFYNYLNNVTCHGEL